MHTFKKAYAFEKIILPTARMVGFVCFLAGPGNHHLFLKLSWELTWIPSVKVSSYSRYGIKALYEPRMYPLVFLLSPSLHQLYVKKGNWYNNKGRSNYILWSSFCLLPFMNYMLKKGNRYNNKGRSDYTWKINMQIEIN